MIPYSCPHCRESLEAPTELVGQDVNCPRCGQRTIVPRAVARVASVANVPTAGITVPLLISAIGNILMSLVWAATIFGIVIAIPLVVLCVFEFVVYFQAGRIPRSQLASKARVLGILEIIAGLFNLISLVCGIIVLVNASRSEGR